MTETGVLELCQRTIMVAIQISAPVLIFCLVAGLVVSIFQAATQIQEMTLSFIPKIIAALVALVICGPWILSTILNYTHGLFSSIPDLIK